jgi:hypothetical protein
MTVLQNSRVIVDGADLYERFGLVLTEDSEIEPPEPKTYEVDIKGGNGSIDLTEALTGDVAYDNRDITLNLVAVGVEDFARLRTKVHNYLHGKRLPFSFSFDPGYTYTGRFKIKSWQVSGVDAVTAEISVTADPYKLKEHCAYRLNATGGRMYRFESGRRPVHPTIECESVCFVTWRGEEIVVPAGTYRLNDVVFREGFNELYVNSCKLYLETWGDLAQGGKDAATWDSLAGYRWDDLQRLGITEDAPQDWAELAETRWEDISANGSTPKRWDELDYRHGSVADTTVYITYDWEDL